MKRGQKRIVAIICLVVLFGLFFPFFWWITGNETQYEKFFHPERFDVKKETIVGVYGDVFIHEYQLWHVGMGDSGWKHKIYYKDNMVIEFDSDGDSATIEGVRNDERGVVYEIYGKTFFRANGSDTFVEIREKKLME